MKSIKWIMPLVVASVLVVSGCSQQTVKPANAANRLTTGNAVGAGVSRTGTNNRLGVSTSGNTLGRGASSSFGRTTSSSFGNGRGTTGSSTSGIGGSLISNGFGSNGTAGGSRLGSGTLGGGSGDNRLGSNGLDNRIGGSGGDYKVTDLNDPSSVLSRRVIYFAYDQSTIEPEYFEILDAHSELLASNPNLTIRLEGHADERGSREYNIALSERRAQSVKQFMDLKGVGSGQSQTVAYGEELPVDPGHNEAAWSKNRRVEIKYIGR
jgi:peptidoglycan-associated lipoprotein